MRFYTTVKLGTNRELTKEGFTLFRNVPISRTGEQIYGPGETDIEPGPDGLVHITRTAEQVFRNETLDSCNGKSLVVDHPMDDVSPDNWQHLTNGVMFNARRGSGELKDHSVADILVTTPYALSEIDNGKREVSLGYDADYIQTGVGRGEQRSIIVNHVALVKAGRCGGSCAIRDHKHQQGDSHMKKAWYDRILDAVRAKDEEGAKKILEEVKDEEPSASGEQHIHIHTAGATVQGENPAETKDEDPYEKRFKGIEDAFKGMCDRMDAMMASKTGDAETEEEKTKREAAEKEKTADDESELAEEAPDGMQDEAKKARDSAYLVDSFENVKMLAEIIAPGVRIPTFDKAADPKKTFKDCVCGLRRKALQLGTADTATAAIIEQVRGRVTDSAEFLKMPCSQVRTIFNSVGALKKAENNSAATRDAGRHQQLDNSAAVSKMDRFLVASKARWTKKQ